MRYIVNDQVVLSRPLEGPLAFSMSSFIANLLAKISDALKYLSYIRGWRLSYEEVFASFDRDRDDGFCLTGCGDGACCGTGPRSTVSETKAYSRRLVV